MLQTTISESTILEKKQRFLKARDTLIKAIATKEELERNEESIIAQIKELGLDSENLDESIDNIVKEINDIYEKINQDSIICEEILKKMV